MKIKTTQNYIDQKFLFVIVEYLYTPSPGPKYAGTQPQEPGENKLLLLKPPS